MTRLLPAGLAIVAILVCGAVHGFWTGRWGVGAGLQAAVARLDTVPLDLQDWKGEDLKTDPRERGNVAGIRYRKYTHRRTGRVVMVYLVCGQPGPVSVHTPADCYGASGYEVSPPIKSALKGEAGGAGDEFMTVEALRKKAADQQRLRIFWSWSTGGAWLVPDNPRVAFAARSALYKLYVVREMSTPGEPLEGDPCLELLQELLPQLRKSLSAA